MKNSAETNANPHTLGIVDPKSEKSGFSLSSIDEHRLSIGLLILVLLVGAGYGIWTLMVPLLPESAVAKTVSRKEQALAYCKDRDWNNAIPLYREMLKDDPENGYATQRLALIRETQLFANWREIRKINKSEDSAGPSVEILDDEAELFEFSIQRWRELRDNTRYRRLAYERIASLHAYRSSQIDAPEEIDRAVKALKEMLDKGLVTSKGIENSDPFLDLQDHPNFQRLVRDEKRNKDFRAPLFSVP